MNSEANKINITNYSYIIVSRIINNTITNLTEKHALTQLAHPISRKKYLTKFLKPELFIYSILEPIIA